MKRLSLLPVDNRHEIGSIALFKLPSEYLSSLIPPCAPTTAVNFEPSTLAKPPPSAVGLIGGEIMAG